MDIAALTGMIAEDAGLRRRQTLQPVGGKGDKIFPRRILVKAGTRRLGTSMNGAG